MLTDLLSIAPPVGWQQCTVGDVSEIRNHLREPISVEERAKIVGLHPYYGPTGILSFINEFRAEGKHVLISEDGDHFLKYKDMPMTILVSGQFNVNNHAHLLRGTPSCSTEWLFYFFNHTNLGPFITRQGVGRYKLTKEALTRLPILLPPMHEQEEICAVFAMWDRAIEQTERLIAAKRRRKQALMQQLLTGKRRFKEFRSYKWKNVRVKDVLEARNELRTVSPQFPLFSLTIENGVTEKTDRYNREALVKDTGKKRYKVVQPFDIVYNPSNLRWGAIGLCRTKTLVLVSPIYEVLSLKSDACTIDYLYYRLSYPDQIRRYEQLAEGTLVERTAVKPPVFLAHQLLLPPIDEQKKIAECLSCCDREIDDLRQKLYALKEQKKGLMQQLLTGKVRVRK